MKQKRHARPTKPMRLFGYNITQIPSATDQTGLIPALPLTDSEEDAYDELYPVDRQKPME